MSTNLPVRAAAVDRSGTITTGGTAQEALGANDRRSYLAVINPDDDVNTGDWLWVNLGGTAEANTEGSIGIAPGGAFIMEGSFVHTGTVSIVGAVTGQPFTVIEYPEGA